MIVDPADMPSVIDADPSQNILSSRHLLGSQHREGQGRELLDRASSTE